MANYYTAFMTLSSKTDGLNELRRIGFSIHCH